MSCAQLPSLSAIKKKAVGEAHIRWRSERDAHEVRSG